MKWQGTAPLLSVVIGGPRHEHFARARRTRTCCPRLRASRQSPLDRPHAPSRRTFIDPARTPRAARAIPTHLSPISLGFRPGQSHHVSQGLAHRATARTPRPALSRTILPPPTSPPFHTSPGPHVAGRCCFFCPCTLARTDVPKPGNPTGASPRSAPVALPSAAAHPAPSARPSGSPGHTPNFACIPRR